MFLVLAFDEFDVATSINFITLFVKETLNFKDMVNIDPTIIARFLCAQRMDSTKVDMDPYLMENDLIFHPVKDPKNIKLIHGMNMDKYLERIDMIFSPYREKN